MAPASPNPSGESARVPPPRPREPAVAPSAPRCRYIVALSLLLQLKIPAVGSVPQLVGVVRHPFGSKRRARLQLCRPRRAPARREPNRLLRLVRQCFGQNHPQQILASGVAGVRPPGEDRQTRFQPTRLQPALRLGPRSSSACGSSFPSAAVSASRSLIRGSGFWNFSSNDPFASVPLGKSRIVTNSR
jgi:hypothetical protein